MTMPLIPRILATVALCLAAGALPLPVVAVEAVPYSENSSAVAEPLLQDVLDIYAALPYYSYPARIDDEDSEYIAESFRKAGEKIRPIAARLRVLPEAEVKTACLLADSVVRQREWMHNVYMGEFGWEFEYPDIMGLEAVSALFESVLHSLKSDSGISPAARETLTAFADACGGVDPLAKVASWEAGAQPDDACQSEYMAALDFFKGVCKAASTEAEEKSLLLLAEQLRVLQKLCGDAPEARLRLNHLVPVFRKSLIEIWSEQFRPPHPYPNPILPQKGRTEPRMQALRPFFALLPALRELLLEPAEWKHASPPASPPNYGADFDGHTVYGIEVFLTASGGLRLVQDGREIEADDLRMDLEETDDMEIFIRLVLEEYAHIQTDAVQQLVQLCESCGVRNFLFAVRPEDSLESSPSGEPLYFVDMVCRIGHPATLAWVEYSADEASPVCSSNAWGNTPVIRIKSPQGRLVEYRSRNCPPSVLRVMPPWSPCGEYLLLPVSPHAGYLLVRVEDLDAPGFDWSRATPINAFSVWQSPPLHSAPSWEIVDETLEIHFLSGSSGVAKYHIYNVESRELTTEDTASSDREETEEHPG